MWIRTLFALMLVLTAWAPATAQTSATVYLPLAVSQTYALPAGNVLRLDGVDDYATTPDGPAVDLGLGADDDFTIEAFFYVADQANTTTDTLVWKQTAYGLYILFRADTPDTVIFRLWTSPIDYVYIYADVPLANGWHHLAAVFDNEHTADSDQAALYLDGAQVKTGGGVDWTPGLYNSAGPLYVGAYAGVNPLAGRLEALRLSNSARYTTAAYDVPAAFAPDANTLALWQFDEPAGAASFADAAGHTAPLTGLNGAVTGAP